MKFNRSSYSAQLNRLKDIDLIKVVTGVRRSGKSTLLKLFAEQLQEQGVAQDQIVQIDFDNKANEHLLNKDSLFEYVSGRVKGDKQHYVFLDEIQMVEDFNMTLNSIKQLGNTDIYITGSNSHLLSSEIGTLLTGRHIDLHLWPLSFAEFYAVDRSDYSKEDSFARYLRYGGFPGIYELLSVDGKLVHEYLKTLMQDIITKDIVVRKRIQNLDAFTKLATFLGNAAGSPISSQNIANIFADDKLPVSHNTILTYIDYLNECFLYSKCLRYNITGKETLRTHYKEYAVDNALLRDAGTGSNIGHQLENLVYNELRTRGYEVFTGKLYNGEVDFVAVKDNEPLYVQVCYLLADENIVEREFGAFKPIRNTYPKIVLSMDSFDFKRDGILHFNLIDWLLDKP